MPEDDDHLDGCELEFDNAETNTSDGEQADALAMFAGVQWDDPEAVERQRVALIEWDHATRGDT